MAGQRTTDRPRTRAARAGRTALLAIATAVTCAGIAAPALEKLDLRWNDLTALPAAAKRLEDRGCFVLW